MIKRAKLQRMKQVALARQGVDSEEEEDSDYDEMDEEEEMIIKEQLQRQRLARMAAR